MKLRIATSVAASAVLALGVAASEDPARRRVIDLEAEIRRRFPDQPVAHGIDARGPWARIGDIAARARPGVEDALRAALAKAEGTT